MAFKESSPMDDIEKVLICSLCLEVLKSPQTLPCTHSYCTECLQKYINIKPVEEQDGIYCPLCRTFSKPGDFINVYMLHELLELYWASKKKRVRKCFACESNEKEATWKCTDCKINLCDVCQNTHKRLPNCRAHKYISSNVDTEHVIDVNIYCESHPDQVMDLYCTECKRPICLKCKVTSHDVHKSETIESTLGKTVPKVRGELKLVENQVTELHDERAKLEKQVSVVEDQHSKQVSECNLTREELVSKLDEWNNDTQKKLTETKEKNLQQLKEALEVNERQRKIKESVIQLTNVTLANAKGCSLLKALTDEVMKRVTDEQKITHNEVNIVHTTFNTPSFSGLKTSVLDTVVGKAGGTVLKQGPDEPQPFNNGRIFAVDLSNVLTDISSVSRNTVNLENEAHRLALVGGNIWIGIEDERAGYYQIFDTSSKTLTVHNFCYKNMGIQTGIQTFCQTSDNKVIAVCETGLLLLNLKGEFIYKFSYDHFTDVCTFEDKLFAVKSNSALLTIFKLANGLWQKVQELSTDWQFDTICTDHACLYICAKGQCAIKKYSFEGKCISGYGSKGVGPGKFLRPQVCGTDASGALIACDSQNRRFHVMDTSGRWEEFLVTGITCPTDILVDKHCAYVLWRRKSTQKLSWYQFT